MCYSVWMMQMVCVLHIHIRPYVNTNKMIFYTDCNIWKYPRTDAEDVYPEVLGDFKLQPLQNEQIFSIDGVKLQVIHTPGHTTDHCILFLNETKEIFSGDCILGEGTAVFEDLFDYMKSLELIINENPTTIYPGHGNIITVSNHVTEPNRKMT